MIQEIYNRAATWNAKRYAREYNQELALQLLREEYLEWLQAETRVDKLDGLCDVVYVALGAIWKLDPRDEEMQFACDCAYDLTVKLVDSNELWPAYMISTYLDVLEYNEGYPPLSSLWNIIFAALTEITGMGLTQEQVGEALRIVCDSNDSKSIDRVPAYEKANKSKGPYFVAPEPKLQALLEAAHELN